MSAQLLTALRARLRLQLPFQTQPPALDLPVYVAPGSFAHTDRGLPLGAQHELFPGAPTSPGP